MCPSTRSQESHLQSPTGAADESHEPGLSRQLSNRHIQLIAIGGAIGTGLFMGSGQDHLARRPVRHLRLHDHRLHAVLRDAGDGRDPALQPELQILQRLRRDLLGPWAGFFTGWTYWFCWMVTGVADIIAIAGYVTSWWPGTPLWIPALRTPVVCDPPEPPHREGVR